MVLDDYLEQDVPLKPLLKILGLPRSTYYYQPTGNKAGKRKAKVFYKDGIPVSRDVLISDMKELLSQEFVDYGYYKTYVHLKSQLSYAIGSTRTYQIMKENKLLKFQRNKQKRKNRNWVKDLVPKVEHPFNFLEFDIKFAYIQGIRTNVMGLTVLDVFSRWNLGHYIATSIKKEDAINLFELISSEHQMPERFIVRNDNGSQFVASQVQEYFIENNIIQEFTKPSTPQQNAHIESYHSIMESAICQRFESKDLDDFSETMDRFRKFYNFDRIHGGLEFTSPADFLKRHGVHMEREAA
jgi:transposase InsO family protein